MARIGPETRHVLGAKGQTLLDIAKNPTRQVVRAYLPFCLDGGKDRRIGELFHTAFRDDLRPVMEEKPNTYVQRVMDCKPHCILSLSCSTPTQTSLKVFLFISSLLVFNTSSENGTEKGNTVFLDAKFD